MTNLNHSGKTVCILGTKGDIQNSENLSAQDFLNACGQNVGNLLFQYACSKLFSNVSLGNIGHGVPYRHDYVNGNHDYLVLPCANFLNTSFDLSDLARYLSNIRIPILPIGLGSQFSSTIGRRPKLSDMHESVQQIVRIFSEKSPLIFVRGDLTKQLLIDYGIDANRIDVLGCPSNFIGDEDSMRQLFSEAMRTTLADLTLIVTGDEVWPKNKLKRQVERGLVRLMLQREGTYLVQSVQPLIQNILDFRSSHLSSDFQSILRYIGFDGNASEVRRYIRIFGSVNSWMFGIRDMSFSTGLRLHGNMCSLQSGIPSVWIYHDSRTEELCTSMGLPSLSLEQAAVLLEEGQYLEAASSVFVKNIDFYFTKRQALYKMFVERLSGIGIYI